MFREKLKKILKFAVDLPRFTAWLVCVFGAAAIIYAFYFDIGGAAAYFAYLLSAYALTVFVYKTVVGVKAARKKIKESKAFRKAADSEFAAEYASDESFKNKVKLSESIAMNVGYAAFRIATGIIHSSVWFIALGGYYVFLSAIRILLFVSSEKAEKDGGLSKNEKAYSLLNAVCVMVFLFDIPVYAIIFEVIFKNSSYTYPSYIIYIAAIHAFYSFISAIVNLIKHKKGNVYVAFSKALNVLAASMSIFGLQTAMITTFSNDSDSFRLTMNAITGGIVMLLIAATSIFMLYYVKNKVINPSSTSDKRIENINENIENNE